IEFLGHVSDQELAKLYAGAKGFLALSQDEDFGITPVESMMAGTPVIAFNGGGYKETVIDPSTGSGQVATGILFDNYSVEGFISAIKKFETQRLTQGAFDSKKIKQHAQKFSKERFKKEIRNFAKSVQSQSAQRSPQKHRED
ncbi:MAG: glycosyltransferase, partial [Patescibacteria group bacterium]